MELKQTRMFRLWRSQLKDVRARALIASRLDRLAYGHVGDAVSVGGGVCELRIHHGPGYRIYYQRRGQTIIVLLCGGNKHGQGRDIKTAKHLASRLNEDYE